MDFELSDDEQALADGMRKLCAGRFSLDKLRALEGRHELDRAAWAELVAAGVFSIRVPEADGGLGLGASHAVVVLEELGRALVPGPVASTQACAGVVPGAADGAVVAVVRPRAATPVVVDDLLSLDALVELGPDGAAQVDLSTVVSRPVTRPVDPLTPLWVVESYTTSPLAGPDAAAELWRDLLVSSAAFLVGIATATTDLAVDYAKQRQQFGKPIGAFQAVKHLCADMVVRAETARAAVHAAAVTVDQPDVGDPVRAAAGAALLAAEAALQNSKTCIQVHGGMGFTWEVPAHLYLMRTRVLAERLAVTSGLAELVADRF